MESCLLILDSFSGYLTANVKKLLRKGNTVMVIIPRRCTSKLQPLDVSINKPFKTELCKSWSVYIRRASKVRSCTMDERAVNSLIVVLLTKFSVKPRNTHQDAILYVFELMCMKTCYVILV